MPTHENPPSHVVQTLLGLSEGDQFSLYFEDGTFTIGAVLAEDRHTPGGEYFAIRGGFWIHVDIHGVEFEFSGEYQQSDNGDVLGEWLDIQLILSRDTTLPIAKPISQLRSL